MSNITTIASTDLITESRADINNNFTALNTDKMETSVLDTDTTLAANSDSKVATQKAVKAYVDAGGNVNASTTNKGIVEEATDAEALAGTATGGSGARLFVNPANITALKPVTRTYNYADSPATWTKPTGLHSLRVQVWGGGGSGGRSSSTSSPGGGGGGGGYSEKIFQASELGTTETVTIGAGGAAKAINTTGSVGGNTTFGSLLTGYGGGGGGYGTTACSGGGGGGPLGVGAVGTTSAGTVNAGSPGDPVAGNGDGSAGLYGGGGGELGGSGSANGGAAYYGGGGGGMGDDSVQGTGGTSVYGGAGGAGATNATATSGSVPGGGGGGAAAGTSGAGGNGRCIITEYYV